ncbi:MAG: PAS domain S-box protein [Deltaproteobacteria bacterium]|nr:PAS domain S-box protein [Deltaproteobacteria bacterium]
MTVKHKSKAKPHSAVKHTPATKPAPGEEPAVPSGETYRDVIEDLYDGFFELDLSGKFTFVNDALCRIHGCPREELLGMNNRQYTDEKNAGKAFDAFNLIFNTGQKGSLFDYEIIRKDGTKRQIEISASLIKDTAGSPKGFRGITRDVTERMRMEEALRQSEERYRTIIESIEDGYVEVDLAGNWTFVNDVICEHMKYPREELIGMDFHKLHTEKSAKNTTKAFINVYQTGKPLKSLEIEGVRKDGTIGDYELSVSLMKDANGQSIGFRCISRDITERKKMEEDLRHSEERYRSIIEQMADGYFEADFEGRICFVNDAECRNLGYTREEIVGKAADLFMDETSLLALIQVFREVYRTKNPVTAYDVEITKKDGTKGIHEISVSLIQNAQGEPLGFRGIARDITERKLAEAQIEYLATHDGLTGLPNRTMFSHLLNQTIRSAKRYKKQFAVMFIDLDRFKIINDTLGHEAGDQLLKEMAARFRQSLRAMDVVARLGGDEFVIMIEEVSDNQQIATVAHKILSIAIKPITVMGEECRVTASIGISTYPKDGEDEQTLLKNADIAMYFAKEEGKNNFQFFSKDIKPQSIERLSLETHLRFALERNELSLAYQAKLDFKTNAITGVEALLRWNNPILGSITPTQFIPVAEETGTIVPIGRWVLKTACAQNVAWQRKGLPPVCMAVNLSLRQLTDENLLEDIEKALKDSGMSPNLLELEITESMVMHNPIRMIGVISKIKNLGVRLALDDFGTGYSSLAQIKHFPIDTLKVDRSFVRNIPDDEEDRAIIEAIIAMGKTLSLTIVAEGVETQAQNNFLKYHSCDEMQGFYFSKPIMPDQFADLLSSHIPFDQKKK